MIPAVFIIFGVSIGYIISQARSSSLELVRQIANESAEKYAKDVELKIKSDLDIANFISNTFNIIDDKDIVCKDLLRETLNKHSDYISLWLSQELSTVDKDRVGRITHKYIRDNYNNISYLLDTVDITGAEVDYSDFYELIKESKKESITEPYYFEYIINNEDAGVSICVPIKDNDKFIGVVGIDVLLSYFQDVINDIEPFAGGYVYMLSNNGTIVSFPEKEMIGKEFDKEFSEVNEEYHITDSVREGYGIYYQGIDMLHGKQSFISFIPVKIGKTETPWSLVFSVPFDIINQKAQSVLVRILLITVLGMLALVILIYFIAKNITTPIKQATHILRKLSKGEVGENEKMSIKTGDEIEDISQSVNELIDGLNRTVKFAKTIGKGDLTAEYSKLGDKDELGIALLDMRESLIVAEKEEEERKKEEDKQNWATQGVAKFSDILRQHNLEISELAFSIMTNLVDYIGAIQGGLFIKNDDNNNNIYYELVGAVAYDRRKTLESKFKVGESLVGRCAYEKLTIYMEEIPEDYVHITSGLGESSPRALLLVPAILNEEVYAVIELVSFEKLESYQIEFVEKIGDSIASTISNAKINTRTNKLLMQSKRQSEELATQEEEMRQNLEELQATQEEMGRLRKEEQEKADKLIGDVKKYKKVLTKVINYIPVRVFIKDSKGEILFVNKQVLDAYDVNLDDILGKQNSDFINDKMYVQKENDLELEIIESGQSVSDIHKDPINSDIILKTIKHQFYIDYLDETGVLTIQMDITDSEKKDRIIKDLRSK
jgi:methyl-accepting chemotaxis protein